ncbi:MAG TPA: hypothetical protein VIJ04_08140 [Xanthobacteraceae bacterium]
MRFFKVNLDEIATRAVHATALAENRSASNAASQLIREAWRRREAAKAARALADPAIARPTREATAHHE